MCARRGCKTAFRSVKEVEKACSVGSGLCRNEDIVSDTKRCVDRVASGFDWDWEGRTKGRRRSLVEQRQTKRNSGKLEFRLPRKKKVSCEKLRDSSDTRQLQPNLSQPNQRVRSSINAEPPLFSARYKALPSLVLVSYVPFEERLVTCSRSFNLFSRC